MLKTIVVRTGRFSLSGLWYYLNHKKSFTNRSFAILLTTVTEGLKTSSISVATSLALCKHVWVQRVPLKLEVKPETELEENDKVIFWMPMGNIHYQVQNNKLVLTEW